jgi:putative transposase
MHEIFNGIIYLLRAGCSWRLLPHHLPPWGTVHYYYRRFRRDGTLLKVHEHLRTKVRKGGGRPPPSPQCGHPGQSVGQDDQKGGPQRGYDPAKKVNGRKRHRLVDTLGLILAVLVHAADVGEREGGPPAAGIGLGRQAGRLGLL